jgi:hypothetical protein
LASTDSATGLTRSAACPAAAETLASARLTASRSARPGSSSSVRSATTSATASSVVRPQRPHHPRGEGHPHAVALEGQVDEVTGPVAGQAAHPQQLEVAAQLPLGDAEVAGGLGHRDALRPGGQVRDEGQQPRHPVGGARRRHALSPIAASRVSRATTASRISVGASTRTSAP